MRSRSASCAGNGFAIEPLNRNKFLDIWNWAEKPYLNSLRPSDAIWRQWSWTTLAQVMACCLTAPSHYLNQCWLIIRGVLWHTSESSFAGIAQGIDSGYEFEKDILKNIFKSPRGQWVNTLRLRWNDYYLTDDILKPIFLNEAIIFRFKLH